MFRYLPYALGTAALLAAGTAWSADLRVEIAHAEQAPVYLALFDAAAGFERREGIQQAVIKRWESRPSIVFSDLPPGRYAVAVFQDLNGNGKLDANLLGIPSEPYGFSRNAVGVMGPPGFDAVAIDIDGQDQTITIELRK